MAKKEGREGWTTMYVPKKGVPGLVDQLQKLILRDLPDGMDIPKYRVMEIALKEAIESRK